MEGSQFTGVEADGDAVGIALGHTTGTITITGEDTTVVVQPYKAPQTINGNARIIDISEFTTLYGKPYEVQFYTDDANSIEEDQLLKNMVTTIWIANGVLLALAALWHGSRLRGNVPKVEPVDKSEDEVPTTQVAATLSWL